MKNPRKPLFYAGFKFFHWLNPPSIWVNPPNEKIAHWLNPPNEKDFHWLKTTNENLFRRFAIVATSTHWKPGKIFLQGMYLPCMKTCRGLVGCPLLYLCRTLNSRPHKNPPMGSRSAVLNAVLLKLVAREKGRFFIPL